ncbi:MAG: GIY-YIG nuclease family protein [Rhodobacteraceae bacterium]|nr:GIY-YIG nuclease family protein [Paracoccaceae bacterium]
MFALSYVYILAHKPKGALYIGVTSDLVKRVYLHKTGFGSAHTAKYSIKSLVWYEIHGHIEEAIRREKRLKKYLRQWKVNLIEEMNPDWRDLYEEICR